MGTTSNGLTNQILANLNVPVPVIVKATSSNTFNHWSSYTHTSKQKIAAQLHDRFMCAVWDDLYKWYALGVARTAFKPGEFWDFSLSVTPGIALAVPISSYAFPSSPSGVTRALEHRSVYFKTMWWGPNSKPRMSRFKALLWDFQQEIPRLRSKNAVATVLVVPSALPQQAYDALRGTNFLDWVIEESQLTP